MTKKIGTGFRQENRTWTGNLGDLQSGIVDMFTSGLILLNDRYEDFLFTTPFSVENFGVLMKQQTGTFFIDTKSVTAGIGLDIYGFLVAILMLLFIVSWFNERFLHSNDRNSSWRLLVSIFPSNGAFWKKQIGMTRKLLMATSGFGILILSSLYQAKLSEQHLIPYPSPVITFNDIEASLLSGRQKLLVPFPNATILKIISTLSPALDAYLRVHPPLYESNGSILDIINAHNALEFGTENQLLDLLSKIPSKECANYMYVQFDGWARPLSGIVMRKEQMSMLESWNVIVAERMPYFDEYIQSFQLDEECDKHLFPVYKPDPTFKALKIREFTGTFVMLGILLFVSIILFAGETVFHKFVAQNCERNEVTVAPFKIRLNVGQSVSAKTRKRIFAYYEKILEEMANDTP